MRKMSKSEKEKCHVVNTLKTIVSFLGHWKDDNWSGNIPKTKEQEESLL